MGSGDHPHLHLLDGAWWGRALVPPHGGDEQGACAPDGLADGCPRDGGALGVAHPATGAACPGADDVLSDPHHLLAELPAADAVGDVMRDSNGSSSGPAPAEGAELLDGEDTLPTEVWRDHPSKKRRKCQKCGSHGAVVDCISGLSGCEQYHCNACNYEGSAWPE